jgi:DNA-directed RNA polymerase sigma subunit (sigma70/sigma32)
VEKFDYKLGYKLTYATRWIRQAVTRACRPAGRSGCLSTSRIRFAGSCARRQLAQKYNREPTEKELAKEAAFRRKLLDLVEDPVSPRLRRRREHVRRPDRRRPLERPDESTSKKLRRNELAEALLLLNPRMRRVPRPLRADEVPDT